VKQNRSTPRKYHKEPLLAEISTNLQRYQLILSFDVTRDVGDESFIDLIKTKSFAACILYDKEKDEARLQKRAANLIKPMQEQDLAVLVAGEAHIAMRIGADGVHREEEVKTALERENKQPIMIGYGNVKDRHSAMELGEAGADYIMFGKLGADKQPQPHPRNLRLATWWASLMEIPCIIQAGTDIEALNSVVETGAEFIAIDEMLFSSSDVCFELVKLRRFLDIMGGA